MIVLDTNVLSAIMKPESNAPAIEWLNRQDHELLRMTVVSLEELAYGLRMMPPTVGVARHSRQVLQCLNRDRSAHGC